VRRVALPPQRRGVRVPVRPSESRHVRVTTRLSEPRPILARRRRPAPLGAHRLPCKPKSPSVRVAARRSRSLAPEEPLTRAKNESITSVRVKPSASSARASPCPVALRPGAIGPVSVRSRVRTPPGGALAERPLASVSSASLHQSIRWGTLLHQSIGWGPLLHRSIGWGPLLHRSIGWGPLLHQYIGWGTRISQLFWRAGARTIGTRILTVALRAGFRGAPARLP
jgi:hypothetical protein